MLAATTSPSYLPTWVSGQAPLTSPIAQRRSRRPQVVVDLAPRAGRPRCRPSPGRCPRPAGAGRWRRGCGRRAARGRRRSPARSPRRRAARAATLTPSTSSIPSPRSSSPSASPSGAGSRASTCGAPSITVALPPSRFTDLGQLHPGRAAAEHEQVPRHRLHAGRLARPPDAVELPQSRHRRHERRRAVGQHHVRGGVVGAVDLDRARSRPAARRPGSARSRFRPATFPGRRPSIRRPCSRARRAPPRRRPRRSPPPARAPATASPGPQQGLRRDAGPVGALAADQLALDHRDPQAARRAAPRRSARRASRRRGRSTS